MKKPKKEKPVYGWFTVSDGSIFAPVAQFWDLRQGGQIARLGSSKEKLGVYKRYRLVEDPE